MATTTYTDDILGAPTTPRSLSEYSASSPDSFDSRDASPVDLSPTPTEETQTKPEPEKKPVKKRKSWGQQLPTPTTNLPPRKRAKTAEEKEQRRVERVLRNRAAAQKSREVKKMQLEKIEQERDILKGEKEKILEAHKQLLEYTQRLEEENRRLREKSQPDLRTEGQLPTPKQEEPSLDVPFTFGLSEFTLDPTTLLSSTDFSDSDGTFSSPCMTHQPAVLMCDLPCQRGISMKTFLLVWEMLVAFMVVIFSQVWMTSLLSRTSTLVWQLLQNLPSSPQTHTWRNSLNVTRAPRRLRSQVCSMILARLRTATDCSSQPAIIAEPASVTSSDSSLLGFLEGLEDQRRRLLDTCFGRSSPWGSRIQGRKTPINNWVAGLTSW